MEHKEKELYRVIIVDDEPIIADGLSKVVDWESLSCEVVATELDGKEGGLAIREHRPHILLTDINMPNVNGLEMLAGLRSEFPQMQVTIISGYSDFAYAQEAMRLGACRYLLKPTKMDEIYEAIDAMKKNLQQTTPEEEENSENLEKSATGEANSLIVRQAVNFMKERYQEKLTLALVAEQCYVSQWHLSKLLNGHLKRNFYDILNEIRVEKAKELLQDVSLRISDVCEKVGYSEAGHFSRVFKKETGMSANEYRSTLAGKK